MSRDTLRLNFSEDSNELFTTEVFRLYNTGNSLASYKWLLSERNTFQITPVEETIKPMQFRDCLVKYVPSGNLGGKADEDVALLQVQDGIK